jgi:hypothetical protein
VYLGLPAYASTYITFIGIQFSIYNYVHNYVTSKLSLESSTVPAIILAGAFSGMFASILTNYLEVVAVHKQTNNDINAWKFFIDNFFTRMQVKGLPYRMTYYMFQSVLMFLLMEEFSLMLNVNFLDYSMSIPLISL